MLRITIVLVAAFILSACDELSVAEEGQIRTFHIAADDVGWDYAPAGKDLISGEDFNEIQSWFAVASDYRLGRKLKKALYYEYTDETFSTRKDRAPEWEHLGWLGPLLRAEVGDTITIHFKNNTSFPASMHPHGVFYEKSSEGALYQDATSGADKSDDAVPPGGTHTYEWAVPERAGPLPGGSSTAFWMYHSHTDEVRDFNTGLVGPMIITARGRGDETLKPDDVDTEFVIAFFTTEEASSWYVEENVANNLGKPEEISYGRDPFAGRAIISPEGPSLEQKDNLNGFIYGNLPMLTMKKDERVRWYLMAGSGFEVHAPHWHGNTAIEGGMRVDTVGLVTMGMTQVNMTPDDPGMWLFHCHVTNHMTGGMMARYEVLE